MSDPADHSVVKKLRIIVPGIVESEVQAPTLLSADGAVDDQRGRGGKITKFQQISRDLEIPIELLDFGLKIA